MYMKLAQNEITKKKNIWFLVTKIVVTRFKTPKID